MAFVNEKLTPEQRENFRSKKIIGPLSIYPINPCNWTIDKVKGICLISVGVDRDNPNEHYFLLQCNGSNTFIRLYRNIQNNSWRFLNIVSTDLDDFDIEEYFPILADALSIYNLYGKMNPSNAKFEL